MCHQLVKALRTIVVLLALITLAGLVAMGYSLSANLPLAELVSTICTAFTLAALVTYWGKYKEYKQHLEDHTVHSNR